MLFSRALPAFLPFLFRGHCLQELVILTQSATGGGLVCVTGWLLTGNSANCQAQEGPEKVLFSGTRPRDPYMSIPTASAEAGSLQGVVITNKRHHFSCAVRLDVVAVNGQ